MALRYSRERHQNVQERMIKMELLKLVSIKEAKEIIEKNSTYKIETEK